MCPAGFEKVREEAGTFVVAMARARKGVYVVMLASKQSRRGMGAKLGGWQARNRSDTINKIDYVY